MLGFQSYVNLEEGNILAFLQGTERYFVSLSTGFGKRSVCFTSCIDRIKGEILVYSVSSSLNVIVKDPVVHGVVNKATAYPFRKLSLINTHPDLLKLLHHSQTVSAPDPFFRKKGLATRD